MTLLDEPGAAAAPTTQPPPVRREPRGKVVVRWITTTDHKKIGLLYIGASFVFFLIAILFAMLMRTQTIVPESGFLSPQSQQSAGNSTPSRPIKRPRPPGASMNPTWAR